MEITSTFVIIDLNVENIETVSEAVKRG